MICLKCGQTDFSSIFWGSIFYVSKRSFLIKMILYFIGLMYFSFKAISFFVYMASVGMVMPFLPK